MTQGHLLWSPSKQNVESADITAYVRWLGERGKRFESYDELWRWSVEEIGDFWETIIGFFDVKTRGEYSEVLSSRKMPGAEWFKGAELNYTHHLFRSHREGPAVIMRDELGDSRQIGWSELEQSVASASEGLRSIGVGRGDRVAAYLPNRLEAVVAFLACAAIGAIWSSCSPDYGAPSVLDRFRQIQPKVLLAARGYSYGGKYYDRSETVSTITKSLPGLKRTVLIGQAKGTSSEVERAIDWEELLHGGARLQPESLPFSHPLWVLYSSGTTGLPKPIVHGHGGIVLEHLKAVSLHNDLGEGDRFLWFTTTGWMMWNYLMGGLLCGATIVLYDGSPAYPTMDALWDLAEKTRLTYFGASAAYMSSCMKAKIEPAATHTLGSLRGIGSTGSPLSPEAFEWLYSHVKEDFWVASISGGTDVASPVVGGCPILPVRSGEIQCRMLGAKVESFDEGGKPVTGAMGELVITEPLPSMPLFFWGDEEGKRYRESYFETFPGVWRHGDWITITERGSCVIHGRSDATIKRLGIRIGTSEIYRSIEAVPGVEDALAIDLEGLGGSPYMCLFVVPASGREFDEVLVRAIKQKIRIDVSPRYVPDEVLRVNAIPYTLNGKKLEVPIRRIFQGADPSKVLNRDTLANPDSVDGFIELARRFRADGKL